MKLIQTSRKQYLNGLRQEIKDSGLRSTIEQRLIAIDELCRGMSYPFYREVQENLSDIYDLLTVFSEYLVKDQDGHSVPKWLK